MNGTCNFLGLAYEYARVINGARFVFLMDILYTLLTLKWTTNHSYTPRLSYGILILSLLLEYREMGKYDKEEINETKDIGEGNGKNDVEQNSTRKWCYYLEQNERKEGSSLNHKNTVRKLVKFIKIAYEIHKLYRSTIWVVRP
jgi:hypothetical protein